MRQFIFTYGSLLNPDSLAKSLPEVDLSSCFPAHLIGYRREFSVAFPNDGTQSDKSYFNPDGSRPAVVLFCDVVRHSDSTVNGVCLPVDSRNIAQLEERERRYDLLDISQLVTLAAPIHAAPLGTVGVFVGKQKFTRPEAVERGVVPRSYFFDVTRGAHYWESRSPGFEADFAASTVLPRPRAVVDLRRVDT